MSLTETYSALRMPCVLALGLLVLGGCNVNRVQQERDALWVQNQELEEQLQTTRIALDQSEAERRELLAQLDRAPQPAATPEPSESGLHRIEGVETIEGHGTVTVRVPGDVLFASGQATLRSDARRTLGQIADVLQREHPNETIRIEGYTDTDPIRHSDWTDNLELSAHRAMAVHRRLQERGISPDRMHVAGFGEHRPRETKERSRRVEIVVIRNN